MNAFLDIVNSEIHSVQVKEFIKSLLIAAKQLGDEAAQAEATSQPLAAPVIAFAQPVADAYITSLIARAQHLEDNQDAEAAASVGVVAPPAIPSGV